MEDNLLLSIDIEFGVFTPDVTGVVTQKYVQMLKHWLEWAYNKAREISAKEAIRSKRRFDRKIRCSKLDIGDLVLVRQKGFTGKHKVADRWEKDYYEVISPKVQWNSSICHKESRKRWEGENTT